MDFAASAAQKTKATPDFASSAGLSTPAETAPGNFAKQLIGALKLTKASDLGRPSPQAEAAREARAAHEARAPRHDDRAKPTRPAKAERPERAERPDEPRYERKAADKSDEPRETKSVEKADKPAKPQRPEKAQAKPEAEKADAVQPAVETEAEGGATAEVAADPSSQAVGDDAAATETAAATAETVADASAEALLVNPFQIALNAANEAPGPIAVTLLQAASAGQVEGDALSIDADGGQGAKSGAEDPETMLQNLLSGAAGRGTQHAEGDASAQAGAAKGAVGMSNAAQHRGAVPVAEQAAQRAVDAADMFDRILAAKIEGQTAATATAKVAGDASAFAAQTQTGAGAEQAKIDAQPIAATQQVQTAQAQTGAKLDQPLAARSTAYLPPAEQVAVQIQRAAEQGASRISIELDPAELGRVEVRLDVDRTGAVSASVFAERQETLDMLKKDQGSLEKALQNAGLSADASNLNFSLREGNKGGREAQDGQGRKGRGARGGDDAEVAPAAVERLGRMRTVNLDRALDIVA